MRRVIWKYPLSGEYNCIKMPGLARPLAVGWQGEQLCLWCAVYPEEDEVQYRFYVAITGPDLPETGLGQYIGTAQSWFGIVAHVFTMSEEA